MKNIINDLPVIIEKYYLRLLEADEEAFSYKSEAGKWSRKEELGHLIDSAQNNIQRFIRVQYGEVQVVYDPDKWVQFNDYQHIPLKDMITLWHLLNKQICHILIRMDPSSYEKMVDIGYDSSDKRPRASLRKTIYNICFIT